MYKQAHCHDEAANHQLPTAVAFWISWIVSMEECSSLAQNLIQNHCSAHSLILNATPPQYTCSLNSIYCPHWLIQWSCHCSCRCIPVHSPWLPGYIDVTFLLYYQWLDFFWTGLIYCVTETLQFDQHLPISPTRHTTHLSVAGQA